MIPEPYNVRFACALSSQEDWSLFLITKKRTTKLKMTEFDETFSEDHAEGTEVMTSL